MNHWRLSFQATPGLRFLGHAASAWQRRAALLGLSVACAFVCWVGWKAWSKNGSLMEIRQQEQSLTATEEARIATAERAAAAVMNESNARVIPRDARQGLNRVIRQLNTPWPALFQQIQRMTPPSVALISIEPDDKRTLTLSAEARTLDTLLVYAASLQGQGVLGDLVYSKHETNEQDSNRPVRLTFQLALKPSLLRTTADRETAVLQPVPTR